MATSDEDKLNTIVTDARRAGELREMFQPFTGLYEPSAILQLADGRFLVVEDEKQHPFTLVTLSAAGGVHSTPLLPPRQADAAVWKLDDLEALAMDKAGYVYALTSHSRDGEGDEKKSRDKLLRFRVDGERMAEPALVKGLKPALVAAHPLLAAAAEVRDVKAQGGLNIEALEIAANGQLLIGLRSPLLDQHAIIACMTNPTAVFTAGEAPRVSSRLLTLDLGGHGIRALSWIPALGGYLVVSGPSALAKVYFQLWFWSGNADDAPRRVRVPGLQGFAHAEGVCPAVIEGQPRIVIVSDDGDRKAKQYAQFLVLRQEQLEIGD